MILRTDGTVYDVNATCARLVGTDKEAIVDRHYADFDPLKTLCERVSESIKNTREDFDLQVCNNKHYEVFILPFVASGGLSLVRVIFKDISSFVTLEKELLRRNRELMIVNSLSSAFISSDNMDLVIENLLKKVLLVTDFSIGWLLMKEDHSFRLKTFKGISPQLKQGSEDGHLVNLCNEVIKNNEPLHILEPPDIGRVGILEKEGIVFLAVIPLIYDEDHIGLLFLASRSGKEKSADFDFAALLTLVGNHVSLIIDKIRLFQETKRLSITDGLTGLYNSRYFYKQLDIEIARTNRYGNSFSLILFDIDNFKRLNDTYGHQAGDDVLHELARLLRDASRETDIVVRYGGEEFIIILPNTSEEDTIYLADRIRTTVGRNAFRLNHAESIHITLSGGIASYPQNAYDTKSLLNAADTALYSAKASGKNMIICFQGRIDEKDIRKT